MLAQVFRSPVFFLGSLVGWDGFEAINWDECDPAGCRGYIGTPAAETADGTWAARSPTQVPVQPQTGYGDVWRTM